MLSFACYTFSKAPDRFEVMAEGTKHPQKLLLFYLTNQRPFGLGT